MFLLPLAFYGAIALTIWFVGFSKASGLPKTSVVFLFAVSFFLRYSRFAMVGFFLQIGLAIFVLLYRKVRSR
jgi:hypothetical protein